MSAPVTFSRAILYGDASGIETGVSYAPTYRLGDDDQSYVKIEGPGGDVHIRVDHIPYLIAWLGEAQAADDEARSASAKATGR